MKSLYTLLAIASAATPTLAALATTTVRHNLEYKQSTS